ncbi:MAG: glycosyltransferase [Treponemataceae bacterium]
MNIPKVSVVVPCYNVDKYIHQCLDSIVNQTLKDIEIICVNDGSKDNTLSILQEYQKKDDRIIIIDQPNAGYGVAMNKGFEATTGEYIGIVESDDFIEKNMFEELYTDAKKNNLDIIKSCFYLYWSNSNINKKLNITNKLTKNKIINPKSYFKRHLDACDFFSIQPSIWSAIYKKDFIEKNTIRFNETPGASYQDASFNFMVYALAEKTKLVEKYYLHYRQDNEQSSVNSPLKVFCICDEYHEIEKRLSVYPELQKEIIPIKQHVKFVGYLWNYYRLSDELRKVFLEKMSEEFKVDFEKGFFNEEYFSWEDWNKINVIINDPNFFYEWVKSGEKNAIPNCSRKPAFYYLKKTVNFLRINGIKNTVLKIFKRF